MIWDNKMQSVVNNDRLDYMISTYSYCCGHPVEILAMFDSLFSAYKMKGMSGLGFDGERLITWSQLYLQTVSHYHIICTTSSNSFNSTLSPLTTPTAATNDIAKCVNQLQFRLRFIQNGITITIS